MSDLQKDIAQLDKYEDAYHNGQALISDAAYDLFKEKIYRQLHPDHPRLSKVGHDVCSAWPKEKHIIFMGSQNKVSNDNEIKAWVEKIYKELGMKGIKFIIQHKIDGFSLEVAYRDKMLDKAVTRGNGLVGENVIPNAKLYRYLPHTMIVEKQVVCRGEGVFTKKSYEEAQKACKETFKNARNAASGVSRRLDNRGINKYLQFIAYDINALVKTELEKIEALKELGFKTVPTYICETIDDILEIYHRVRDKDRETYEYEIDGLVLKINDIDLQDKLGIKNGRPTGQVALKFDPDQAITTLKEIALQVGRTGKITPVAILVPVELMGTTVKKASLHNFSYIEESMIGIGAEVSLSKRGEIIPQVEDIITPGEEYVRPDKCPSCGGPVEYDGVNLWCRNPVCKERDINKIVYWIEILDMKGFSAKFVEKLWDVGKLRSVADLYKLKEDDFLAVGGIGEKTVKSFFSTMKATSEMFLSRFIIALGISSCSKSTADDLVEHFGTWDKIVQIEPADLQKISGYAEISSKTICEGIAEVREMADELLKVIIIKKKKEGVLSGMSFCVTGSLSSMGRKEFFDLIVEKGGVAKSSVVEGLTYLVSNSTDSGSSKSQRAKKLGVKVINEEEFLKLLGEDRGEIATDIRQSQVKIVTEKLF